MTLRVAFSVSYEPYAFVITQKKLSPLKEQIFPFSVFDGSRVRTEVLVPSKPVVSAGKVLPSDTRYHLYLRLSPDALTEKLTFSVVLTVMSVGSKVTAIRPL